MAKKRTLIELTEVVPEIQGIERVRDAATLLDNYPLYRPAREFCQSVMNCFSHYGLGLEELSKKEVISLQTPKETTYLARIGGHYYFGYKFKGEVLRVFFVGTTYAKRLPYFWPDLLWGDMNGNELVPLVVFIDGQSNPIEHRPRFPFFGGERFS